MAASYLDINKSSGYGEIIEKIVEAKRIPIKAKEEEKKKESLKISGVAELQKEMAQLESFSSKLSGAASVFSDFKLTADAPDCLSGTARKNAPVGEHQIKIVRVASAHRIASRELSDAEEIPAGDFTLRVNGKNYDFRFAGGSLSAFKKLFDRRAEIEKVLSASVLKKSADKNILLLSSEITGPNGAIELIADNSKLFSFLELFGPPEDKKENAALFSGQGVNQKEVFLSGKSELTLPVNGSGSLASDDLLLWKVDWTLKTQATNSQVSNLVGMSNAAPTNTADALSLNGGLPLKDKIELDGESLSFDLLKAFNEKRKSDLDQEKQKSLDELKAAEAKKKQEEQAASEVNFVVGKLHYQVDGKDAEKIYSLPVTFTNRENGATGSASFVIKASDLGSGQVVLKNIALQNGNIWVDLKVTLPEKNASTVTSGTNSVKSLGLTAKHEVSPPRTALLEYKGIVLEREKNKVNDVLEGVSLDLKKAKNDAISFRIEWNDENILNHLINYVGQYNIIMEMINQFLSSDKPGMEVKEEIKPRYGLFRGELALQMLKSKLRQIAIDMHPTSQSETLSLLSQMGISPPYSGGNPNDVNIGKLEMKEDVTKKMIHEHPELVAELFAYDKDGDKIPEVGVAIDTTKLTKNYITRGAVLDVEKDTAKKRIEQLDKEIKVAEASLETYRKKMVSEFTTLEAAQKEFEKVRKYFDAVGGGKE